MAFLNFAGMLSFINVIFGRSTLLIYLGFQRLVSWRLEPLISKYNKTDLKCRLQTNADKNEGSVTNFNARLLLSCSIFWCSLCCICGSCDWYRTLGCLITLVSVASISTMLILMVSPAGVTSVHGGLSLLLIITVFGSFISPVIDVSPRLRV